MANLRSSQIQASEQVVLNNSSFLSLFDQAKLSRAVEVPLMDSIRYIFSPGGRSRDDPSFIISLITSLLPTIYLYIKDS